jgi:Tfp pilus assembly protein PilN
VRPVNLIPKEQQRGGGATGRTGFVPYLLLGALGLAVLGVAAVVLTSNKVNSEKSKVAQLNRDETTVRAAADALRPYGNFAQVKQARVATVNSLVDTSFNWERVIRSLSRTIPSNVWLTQFTGTTSPNVKVESGGTSGVAQARASVQSPAVELSGCTYSHSAVARMMVRMRNLDDVSDVLLQSSEKPDSADQAGSASAGGGATGGGQGGGDDCRTKYKIPKFEILVVLGHSTAGGPVPDTGTTAAPGGPVAAAQGAAATASSPSSAGPTP